MSVSLPSNLRKNAVTKQGVSLPFGQIAAVVPEGDVGVPRIGFLAQAVAGDDERVDEFSVVPEVAAQAITVGVAEIGRLLRIENALLIALKLLQAEAVLLKDFVGFF